MNQQIGHHTVRVLGRTVMDGGMLWMLSSLSEAGFRVTGARHLEMVLRSDDTTTDPSRAHLTPRYAVLVDGDIVMDHCMKEPEETITVFDSGVPWGAEIRFRKLSECTQSIMAIREIRTDGKIVPLEEHGPRIEFIGDSITCGYGVDDSNTSSNFSTEAENALKSYAVLTAKILGADYSLFSYSGYGIISGYTDDGKRNTREVLPQWYETFGFSYSLAADGSKTQDIPWDFSKFMPDIVVLNLGTNDNSYCRMNEGGYEEFEEKYLEFLRTIRRCNPQAHILCVMGMMETGVDTYIRNAAKRSGDERCTCVSLTTQNGWLGYGSNWHPSEDTHAYRAKELAEYITQAMENGTISISK